MAPLDFVAQIMADPITYNEQLTGRMIRQQSALAAEERQLAQKQAGIRSDQMGVGRSAAGGEGLREIADIRSAGRISAGIDNVEQMAARQRLQDLANAFNVGQAGINAYFDPVQRQIAEKQGAAQILTGTSAASAQLAATQASPFDYAMGVFGSVLGSAADAGFGKLFG